MGSYKLRRLQLQQNFIEILGKHNIHSCKNVLSITKLELQSLLGISSEKAEGILKIISKKFVSQPETIYDMCKNQGYDLSKEFFPLSLHSLDFLLQGGLPIGSITEIAGPPGVGKTQFCFMLSVLATLPASLGGLGGQVIYIDTESAFCAKRLRDIAYLRVPHVYRDDKELGCLLQMISVHKATTIGALKEIISNMEKDIIRNNVKLVIVDSIASLIRKEYGTDNVESFVERNKTLLQQAAILKDLAQTYKLVVFLTNQITSHVSESENIHLHYSSPDESDYDDIGKNSEFPSALPPAGVPRKKKKRIRQRVDEDHVIPALGATWSHCVNTRLVAQFLDPSTRQLTIMKSPVAPNASVRYTLDESGIILTDSDIEFVSVSDPDCRNILTKNNFLTSRVTGTGIVFSLGD